MASPCTRIPNTITFLEVDYSSGGLSQGDQATDSTMRDITSLFPLRAAFEIFLELSTVVLKVTQFTRRKAVIRLVLSMLSLLMDKKG